MSHSANIPRSSGSRSGSYTGSYTGSSNGSLPSSASEYGAHIAARRSSTTGKTPVGSASNALSIPIPGAGGNTTRFDGSASKTTIGFHLEAPSDTFSVGSSRSSSVATTPHTPLTPVGHNASSTGSSAASSLSSSFSSSFNASSLAVGGGGGVGSSSQGQAGAARKASTNPGSSAASSTAGGGGAGGKDANALKAERKEAQEKAKAAKLAKKEANRETSAKLKAAAAAGAGATGGGNKDQQQNQQGGKGKQSGGRQISQTSADSVDGALEKPSRSKGGNLSSGGSGGIGGASSGGAASSGSASSSSSSAGAPNTTAGASSSGPSSSGASSADGGKPDKPKKDSSKGVHHVPAKLQYDDKKMQAKVARNLAKQQITQRADSQKQVEFFSHLRQYERDTSLTANFIKSSVHPAITTLGLKYAENIIVGSNARALALMTAFRELISDYQTPSQKELRHDLAEKLKPNISFLTQCRPLSVSMGNAIRFLKLQLANVNPDLPEAEAKEALISSIDNFVRERIVLADQAISKTAQAKIHDGDIILVHASSHIVLKVLCEAFDEGKKFSVVVVDSRPRMEGKQTLRRLVQHGIKCSYVLIDAVSYVMKEVSKVFLGAHTILKNGYVMSRVGTSVISMMAKSYNVPVIVCCETYKFCDRSQTDSFVFNELGDPDELVAVDREPGNFLSEWRAISALKVLNLVYDITPPSFVDMVITEVGMIPCTSVPVVLREYFDQS